MPEYAYHDHRADEMFSDSVYKRMAFLRNECVDDSSGHPRDRNVCRNPHNRTYAHLDESNDAGRIRIRSGSVYRKSGSDRDAHRCGTCECGR